MNQENSKFQEQCPSEAISAYLDFELSQQEELELEKHISICSICFEELNTQKNILLAVNSALSSKDELEPPADFAKVVAVSAASQISGRWSKVEIYKIILICFSILIVSVIGLADARKTLSALISIIETASAAVLSVFYFIDNFASGLGIVARSLGRHTFSHSSGLAVLAIVGVVFSAFALVKLFASQRKS